MPSHQRKSVLLALGWYVHGIHVGVSKYAAEANWYLEDIPTHKWDIPIGCKVDGIITTLYEKKTKVSQFISNSNLPIVNVSTDSIVPHLPSVLPDNHAIGKLIAHEFLSKGFEHFAFYCQGRGAMVVEERLQGYKTALDQAGKKFYLIDYTEDLLHEGKRQKIISKLSKELQKLPRPLALTAQFDADANLVVRAALAANLKVPDEIAVIGVDNDPIQTRFGPVPLSSVDTNQELIGYQAAALLDDLMRGKKAPKTAIRVPIGSLYLRRSSEISLSNDMHVTKALQFIHRHFNRPIMISEIVQASHTSCRSLYIKFKKHLNKTPWQELTRQRVNHAKKLLMSTDLKIETVAVQSGFKTTGAFSKTFKKETKNKPTYFRLKPDHYSS